MFTGIIETLGTLENIESDGGNIHFEIRSDISHGLKIDQSVAHDGVCLTVVGLAEDVHRVTAIRETLEKSRLGAWKIGDQINLERCMLSDGRFDGHIVQGHVDTTATCTKRTDDNGSTRFYFSHPQGESFITVVKGSITINGVSLTVVDSDAHSFSVAIIPFTLEHTNLNTLQPGDKVNLEFDIIGKYVSAMMRRQGVI